MNTKLHSLIILAAIEIKEIQAISRYLYVNCLDVSHGIAAFLTVLHDHHYDHAKGKPRPWHFFHFRELDELTMSKHK